MILTLVVFALATLGSKVLSALAVIFHLLPAERSCPACDRETVVLAIGPGLAPLARLLRLQRRWCLHCGERTLACQEREIRIRVGPAAESKAEHPA